MKNNKIIENRPELTQGQITQGMNFNKIKTNAALAKSTLFKLLILKGFLGVIVISSAIFIYNNYEESISAKKQIVLIDTVKMTNLFEKDSVAVPAKSTVEKDTTKTAKNKTSLSNSIITHELPTNTNDSTTSTSERENEKTFKTDSLPVDPDTKSKENVRHVVKSKNSYKLNQFTRCKLWKPKSFCDIPKNARLSGSYDVDAAEYDHVNCRDATKNIANIQAVWITIDARGNTKFQLESQLKNITLIKSNDGKELHPLMINIVKDGRTFFGKDFKAKKFVAKYDGSFDIFLFFSEASIGDTIFIKNFIETVILE